MPAFVPGFEYDVFISYAHQDDVRWVRAFEEQLCEEVSQRLGLAICAWQDTSHLRAGEDWQIGIQQGIRQSAAFVAVLGGATDPGAARWSSARLVEATVADLGRAVGLRGKPLAAVVRKMPRALPQYEIGHGRFLAAAEAIEKALPGVILAGSYRDGISVGDCLARGEAAAERLARAAT